MVQTDGVSYDVDGMNIQNVAVTNLKNATHLALNFVNCLHGVYDQFEIAINLVIDQ